ncbi:MAG: RNA-binding domain-containing protein [Syntrophales bacterium]
MTLENNSSANTPEIPRNGYELVSKVLRYKPGGGVDALMRLANNRETDWLEWKRTIKPSEKDRNNGENEFDLLWHVVKGVISMLNQWGGAVIIGIADEDCKPVGWGSCCENGIIPEQHSLKDKSFNDCVSSILNKKKWKTGIHGNWSLRDDSRIPTNYIDARRPWDYGNEEVIVIEVRPLPKDRFPLWVIKLVESKGNVEKIMHLYQRRIGDRGQNEPITDAEEFYKIKCERDPNTNPQFSYLWKKFLDTVSNITDNNNQPNPIINTKWDSSGNQVSISVVSTHPKAKEVRKTLSRIINYQGTNKFWRVTRDYYIDHVVTELENVFQKGCCPRVPER